MRRIAADLPIVVVAATLMAVLVLVAGTLLGAVAQAIVESYTARSPLCTVSYCEPAELAPTSALRSETTVGATAVIPHED